MDQRAGRTRRRRGGGGGPQWSERQAARIARRHGLGRRPAHHYGRIIGKEITNREIVPSRTSAMGLPSRRLANRGLPFRLKIAIALAVLPPACLAYPTSLIRGPGQATF